MFQHRSNIQFDVNLVKIVLASSRVIILEFPVSIFCLRVSAALLRKCTHLPSCYFFKFSKCVKQQKFNILLFFTRKYAVLLHHVWTMYCTLSQKSLNFLIKTKQVGLLVTSSVLYCTISVRDIRVLYILVVPYSYIQYGTVYCSIHSNFERFIFCCYILHMQNSFETLKVFK